MLVLKELIEAQAHTHRPHTTAERSPDAIRYLEGGHARESIDHLEANPKGLFHPPRRKDLRKFHLEISR